VLTDGTAQHLRTDSTQLEWWGSNGMRLMAARQPFFPITKVLIATERSVSITIFGSGYMGLVTVTCFAAAGVEVTGIDVDPAKLSRLQQGECPIYEPGLQALMHEAIAASRLRFTVDAQLASRLRHRAANEAVEDRIARKREALEAAEGRERTARRARIQNGCVVAQCRYLLADTSRDRLQLSEALAVMLEELRPHRA